MPNAAHEAFVREAASKQLQYERDRRKASDHVLAYYRSKFGEGHVK